MSASLRDGCLYVCVFFSRDTTIIGRSVLEMSFAVWKLCEAAVAADQRTIFSLLAVSVYVA